ncbi:MAG: phosphoenolpyruvate carboxykinase (ATP) [Luteitalea sp.]|nr:phosphoenolpyruvate carboxykinase (ATP) [Luteitalea sp.]
MSSDVEHARSLHAYGIRQARVHWNLSRPAVYERAVCRGEGLISDTGQLVCRTAPHTGRSPHDKFIVREPSSEEEIWWGEVNRPIERDCFAAVRHALATALEGKDLFVQDCYAGADPRYRLRVRVIAERAWHCLFARHLFLPVLSQDELAAFLPELTIMAAPGFEADPTLHRTRSGVCILLSFDERLVLIGGTNYAGEIKKAVFTVMNYLLPKQGVLPMHCSANVGEHDDVAIFFGLSGTGKTTLSSDADRHLIGDDEHAWSDEGIFNIEGGCYAKMIRLSAEAEPQIHRATHRFGTLLENVTIDLVTRTLDLDDDSTTENTRGAYPLDYIDNARSGGTAGHPRNIIMLAADAFGVLPPVARLTPEGALYHFLSGYTAKVAGTERGVTEPRATFSTCFGAPFLPLRPEVYARALGERIARHSVRVWLVNTGWIGGSYGVGTRMSIGHTRAMLRAVLTGALDEVSYETDGIFNLAVPTQVPGVPGHILKPRDTWPDQAAYDTQATTLARMFAENFSAFASSVSPAVAAAGPRLG